MIPKRTKKRGTRFIKKTFKTHEDWLESRYEGIGASEAAAASGMLEGLEAMGHNVMIFDRQHDVWLKKLRLAESSRENAAMKQGHVQEPYIASLFKDELGFDVIRTERGTVKDWIAVDPEMNFLRVSPDFIYWNGNGKGEAGKSILECKSSLEHERHPEDLDQMLISYYLQTQYQMYVTGYYHCYIGFLCIKTDYHWFKEIEYNASIALDLVERLKKFWNDNVLPARKLISEWGLKLNDRGIYEPTPEQWDELNKYAPPISSAEQVSRRYPKQVEDKALDNNQLSEDFFDRINEYIARRNQIKELSKQNEEFENYVKLLMGDCEYIAGSDGKPVVTFKQNKSTVKFDQKLFSEKCPTMYMKYLKETAGARVFKIK